MRVERRETRVERIEDNGQQATDNGGVPTISRREMLSVEICRSIMILFP